MVKKLLLIAMLVPFLLFMGCELLGLTEEDVDPIIGTWVSEYTDNGFDFVETLILSDDGTYSIDILLDGTPEFADTGTFTYTETNLTVTGDSSGTVTVAYTLDSNTLTIDFDGNVTVYTRQ